MQLGKDVMEKMNEFLFRKAGGYLIQGRFYHGFGLFDFYVSVHHKLDVGHVAEIDLDKCHYFWKSVGRDNKKKAALGNAFLCLYI